MPRTQIDGDQIQDETIEGKDILDGSIQRREIDISTAGEALIRKLLVSGNGLNLTYTGADIGTGDVTLELGAGNFGTQYYEFESPASAQTTSNNWVNKATFTTPSVPSGKYVIHYRGSLTNSQKKTVGFQVQWRPSGGAFASIEESFKEPTTANIFETRAAFAEVTLSADNSIEIEVNYGQTTGGGVGKIENVAVYLFKVGEI